VGRGTWDLGLVLALAVALLPASLQAMPPESPAEAPPGPVRLFGASVAGRALALPATRPTFSLAFPVDFGRRLLWDGAYLLTAPLRWEGREWLEFSLFIGGVGAALGLDGPITTASQNHPPTSTENDVENAIEKFAEAPGIAGVLGGGVLLGVVLSDDRLVSQAITTGEALLFAEVLFVTPTKVIMGRQRPNTDEGPFAWFEGGRSFPSGHTSSAFVLATGLSAYANNSLWVAVPAYALATGVAVARVRTNSHFVSDVIAGGVIGLVTTRSMLWLEEQRRHRDAHDRTAVTIVPMLDAERRGAAVALRF